jgi:putative modified peptide
MKPSKPYDDERLARLLRLLRPAPRAWVARAQRIPLELGIRARPAPAEATLTDGDVAELSRGLELDPTFRQRFDADPVAATEAAGMHGLALQIEREIRELLALAERIASDDAYRTELAEDPLAALVAAGVPEATTEPLLEALALPEEVLAKLPEVAAHQLERLSLKARLLLLLLGSTVVAGEIRSAAQT